jgi:hypothetical protein
MEKAVRGETRTPLFNYIPLAERGQNTSHKPMRKMARLRLAAQAFLAVRVIISNQVRPASAVPLGSTDTLVCAHHNACKNHPAWQTSFVGAGIFIF